MGPIPLMHFHGNPIPADEDPMVVRRIKSHANEEAIGEVAVLRQLRDRELDRPHPRAQVTLAVAIADIDVLGRALAVGRAGGRVCPRAEGD